MEDQESLIGSSAKECRTRRISQPAPTSSPISEVYSRARRRIQVLSECGSTGDTQFVGSRRIQYLSAFASNMGALALGTVLSWTAVSLPDLRKDPLIGPGINDDTESWVSSIVTLAAVIGAPFAGWALEKFGRRKSMLLLSIPFFIGWLLIYIGTDVTMIIVGRFITGFTGGSYAVISPIFTAEIGDVNIRGLLGACFDLMICVGQLFIFALGTFMSWRNYTLICTIVPVVIFVIMLFVPESPLYLIEKGDEATAILSLMRLRGAYSSSQIEEELNELKRNHLRHQDQSANWRDLIKASIFKPVSISLVLFTLQVISGIDPILFYTVDIFRSAGSTLDEYYSTIIIGVVQVIGAIIGAALVERSGRKILLILSEIFMSASLMTLSLYFFIKRQNDGVSPASLGFLPLSSLIVFVLSYSFGVGPMSYLMLGELVPPQVKGLASCILTCIKWFISFILVKFFGDIVKAFGPDGGYMLFAIFCFLGLIYILFVVPETKGKSLDEIQAGFASNSTSVNHNELAIETRPLTAADNEGIPKSYSSI